MIPDFTKEDIAKLSEKEQETIARLAIDHGRWRRETIERASTYPGQGWVPVLLGVGGMILAGQISRIAEAPRTLTSVIAMIIVLLLMVIHRQWGANRRLDAMLKLIKEQARELERLKGTQCVGQTFLSDQNEGSCESWMNGR